MNVSFDTFVWFFFRLIDVAVIGGIGWYLLKHQLLPVIKARMEHDAYAQDQLEQHVYNRQMDVIARQEILRAEQLYEEKLKHILIEWAQVMHERHEKNQQRRMYLLELQQERMRLQQEALAHQQMCETVVPETVAHVRREISALFTQPDEARAYVDRLVDGIREQS